MEHEVSDLLLRVIGRRGRRCVDEPRDRKKGSARRVSANSIRREKERGRIDLFGSQNIYLAPFFLFLDGFSFLAARPMFDEITKL